MFRSVFEAVVGSCCSGIVPSPLSRAVLACFVACAFVLIACPCVITILRAMKMGQHIRTLSDSSFYLAELHKTKSAVPTMGGIVIIGAIAVSMAIFSDWSSCWPWMLLSAMVWFGCIGAIDDYAKFRQSSFKGIPGRVRMVWQTVGVVFCLIALRYLGSWRAVDLQGVSYTWAQFQASLFLPWRVPPCIIVGVVPWLAWYLLQWGTIVGTANAVNLTDGLDGLAAGCSVCASASLALLSMLCSQPSWADACGLPYIEASSEVAISLAALCGACLGFLWFNAHPARVFMGDTGSLAIGGLLGTAAVCLHMEWMLAVVGIVFASEAMSVICQVISFKITGQRIFRCTPWHHHFEYAGVPEETVVIRFWIVSLCAAILGYALLLWRL